MAITAKNIGTNSEVIYHATPTTTEFGTFISGGSKLGGIQSGSLDISNNMVDTTNNDDAGYTSAEYGNQSATLTVDCIFDPTDTAQAALIAACKAKTKVGIGAAPIYTSNEQAYVFGALVESMSLNPGENDAAETISFSFVSTGAITLDATWTAA